MAPVLAVQAYLDWAVRVFTWASKRARRYHRLGVTWRVGSRSILFVVGSGEAHWGLCSGSLGAGGTGVCSDTEGGSPAGACPGTHCPPPSCCQGGAVSGTSDLMPLWAHRRQRRTQLGPLLPASSCSFNSLPPPKVTPNSEPQHLGTMAGVAKDKVSSHSGVVPAAQSSLPFPWPVMVACVGSGVMEVGSVPLPQELGSVYLCFYHLLLPSAV